MATDCGWANDDHGRLFYCRHVLVTAYRNSGWVILHRARVLLRGAPELFSPPTHAYLRALSDRVFVLVNVCLGRVSLVCKHNS